MKITTTTTTRYCHTIERAELIRALKTIIPDLPDHAALAIEVPHGHYCEGEEIYLETVPLIVRYEITTIE